MKLSNWFVSVCSIVSLNVNEASSMFPKVSFRGAVLYQQYWKSQNLMNQLPRNLTLMLNDDVRSDIEEIDQIVGDTNDLINNSGLVLGDALIDIKGEVFFFLEKSKCDVIQSTLMKASNGHVISDSIDKYFLVKKYEREHEKFLDYSSDPAVNGQFKLMQSYDNNALLMSVQSGMVFVAPVDDIDGMLRGEYQERLRRGNLIEQKRQEAENKRILADLEGVMVETTRKINFDEEDFSISPDTVAYSAREQSFIQRLFASTESFIAMLVRKEVRVTDAMAIVREAERIFKAEMTVGSILIRPGQNLTVVGDIHGQFEDLLRIFKLVGWPSPTNMFLFNGDIVDRGSSSIECLLMLYVLKIKFPRYFFINRGNHESETFGPCTFLRDCTKFDKTGEFYGACQNGFKALPIAHVINSRIYVVHGGIRADFSIKELSRMNRAEMSDFLYASLRDDASELPGLTENHERGPRASKFGPDVTESFLQLNEFDKIIRSHTYNSEGIVQSHDTKCWTVFSAPNYLNRGNVAAVITFDCELTPLSHYFKSKN